MSHIKEPAGANLEDEWCNPSDYVLKNQPNIYMPDWGKHVVYW